MAAPLLSASGIRKAFGPVVALDGVNINVDAGKVTCLLGDNGAGKSTLIKILSGVETPNAGEIRLDGRPVSFHSARDALDRGIATVYQDLAVVPVMPVYRNFFLGREPTTGWGPFRRFDKRRAMSIAGEELTRIGIEVGDVKRPIVTLSGGERQSVAIARAVHFGARVLILDEPTSALGVKEAEVVLRYIRRARNRGIGVILITHNVHHAFPVGDTFTILKRGHMSVTFNRGELSQNDLITHMAGGEALQQMVDDVDDGEPTAVDRTS
jgi:simple sugar transport system ATP-binding protein